MQLMERSFDPTVFTKHRQRLLEHQVGSSCSTRWSWRRTGEAFCRTSTSQWTARCSRRLRASRASSREMQTRPWTTATGATPWWTERSGVEASLTMRPRREMAHQTYCASLGRGEKMPPPHGRHTQNTAVGAGSGGRRAADRQPASPVLEELPRPVRTDHAGPAGYHAGHGRRGPGSDRRRDRIQRLHRVRDATQPGIDPPPGDRRACRRRDRCVGVRPDPPDPGGRIRRRIPPKRAI